MIALIIMLGFTILLAGVVIVTNPDVIYNYLRDNHKKLHIYISAVMARLIIGALLVNQSEHSKYPLVIEILGWLSIVAALTLTAIGRQKFQRLIYWALKTLKQFDRVGGLFAVAFGGFLIYAFV